MGKDEIQAAIDKLDAMSERCDAIARRQTPIKPDMSLPRREVRKGSACAPTPEAYVHQEWLEKEAIASGTLAGNEMRVRGKPRVSPGRDYPQSCHCQHDYENEAIGDGFEDIFAGFERAFDEMARHR